MFILGVDPGLARTGLGLIHIQEGQAIYHCHKLITTDAKAPLNQRLHSIFDQVSQYLQGKNIDVFIVEELFVGINRNTVIKLSMARSMLLLLASMHGARVIDLPTKIVKQHVTGTGSAEKDLVADSVQKKLALAFTQQDCLDALACALCWDYVPLTGAGKQKQSKKSKNTGDCSTVSRTLLGRKGKESANKSSTSDTKIQAPHEPLLELQDDGKSIDRIRTNEQLSTDKQNKQVRQKK